MNEHFKVAKKDVAAILNASFPAYSGRKFVIEVSETIALSDVHWGGGTRNQYVAVKLSDGQSSTANVGTPWDSAAEGAKVPVPQGVVIVEHSIFCGKDVGVRVYVNPVDVSRVLPARVASYRAALKA